uniref:WD repeat domain 88 n=1 Tax=Cercocebus atys TaxID=9531 RepID=A0A2K5MTZ4_CERAT
MASPRRCSPTAPDRECKLPPPSAPAGEYPPGKLSWGTVARALGRFRLSIPHTRLLATLDPLALDREPPLQLSPEKQQMPEKLIWGDQEPLSKVRTTARDSGLFPTREEGDAVDGSVVRNFEHRPKAPVVECSITADSSRVIAASYDKTVRAWDLETGKLLVRMVGTGRRKTPGGGRWNQGFCLKDGTPFLLCSADHHTRTITSCCFDPDSQRVASVSLDRCIKIWDVTSQATLLTITKAHSNAISNCCFTFSGHFLCTSSWDKNLKIWNVHTGEFRNRGACVTLMQGHEGSVSSCHFARDSSFLISGGFDGTVAIWDVAEGYRKLSLKGHNDWVMDVAISNNKKWILSASKDTTMRLWNIEEIDEIPLVIKYKKAMGLKVKQEKKEAYLKLKQG